MDRFVVSKDRVTYQFEINIKYSGPRSLEAQKK